MAAIEPPVPEECSLLVAITFHHLPRRVIYLLDVVRALADFPVRAIDIRVMINDVPDKVYDALHEVLAGTVSRNATVTLVRCRDLEHPFHLTWAHKRLIPDEFLAASSPHTHFVYLEDDMRFSFRNFRYFLDHRRALAELGLIPSFVRVEYGEAAQEIRCTDIHRTLPLERLKKIEIGPYFFVSPPIPYCAMYVLDRELALEHVASAAFDRLASEKAVRYDTRMRAAFGQCWENIPRGFRSRHAIAIDPARAMAAAECWVPHLPNNYVTRMATPSAKLPMRNIITPAGDGHATGVASSA
jgi:hypothetical protein